MKKIYKKQQFSFSFKRTFAIASVLLVSSIGFSQNGPIDFESGGYGATWTWTSFENVGNAPLEIVNNPSSSSPNTSSKVAKLTPLIGGQPWAGVECKHTTDVGKFTLSSSNAIVKIMVYKSVISDVGIKFAINSGGSTGEIKVANTKTNQWEELTFDFSAKIGEGTSTDIDQIIIFPDFQTRTTDNICYFDNITFSSGATLAEPTVAAKTPVKLAANVISLFSNAYTNVIVDTWKTSWSVATYTPMQVAGNDVKKYSSLDYVGIETVVNQINITTMDSFEVDMWTPNVTTFNIKLVDFGPDGAFGGGDDKEHSLPITPTLNAWNHIVLPISSFTGLTTKAHIAQLLFVGVPAGSSVIYIDNVLFSKKALNTNVANLNTAKLTIYPNPANSSLNMSSQENIESVSIFNALGQVLLTASPNANNITLNIAEFATGLYTIKTIINGNISISKVVIK